MRRSRRQNVASHYVLCLGVIYLLTLALSHVPLAFRQVSVPLIYLLAVLLSASRLGLWPAMFTVLLASFTLIFFFTSPIYSLEIAAPQDLLEITVFSIVALITSGLAEQVRQQASAAQQRSAELAILYNLSQTISAEVELDRTLPAIAHTATQLVGATASRIRIYNAQGVPVARAQAGDVGATGPSSTPIYLKGQPIGDLQIWLEPEYQALGNPAQELLHTLAGQIGLVIERARLVEEIGHMRVLADSDQLKSALLLAVSHDFRTPLSLIKGATSNVLEDDVAWDQAALLQFFSIIDTETDRLNRLVANLLDMARIEAGALHTARGWQDIGELAADVLRRLHGRLAQHQVRRDIPADLPLVQANYTQLEQVLTNLLENAAQYTPPGTRISIQATAQPQSIQIAVCDEGPGIPADLRKRLFRSFVHSAHPERPANGTGLGLAICKGLIAAHGGEIWVEHPPDGGACFIFTLPIHASQTAAGPMPSSEREQNQ